MLDKAGPASRWCSALEQEVGKIDILVNNAGVGQVVPLALMEEEDWDRMMDVNVKGAFLDDAGGAARDGPREARPHPQHQLARRREDDAGARCTTARRRRRCKGFTEALAKEIGRYGITVNCLAPGVLEEGVSAQPARPRAARSTCATARWAASARSTEVAEVVAFIASRPQQLHERRDASSSTAASDAVDQPSSMVSM